MKTPISYYGGKQNLAAKILELIPPHTLYCEPFVGGAAVFFAKDKSEVEVINDTNKNLITFYRVVQNDFVSLEKEVRISLHSRTLHRDAAVIYNAPHLFNEVKVAWATWVTAQQSFSSMLDGSWGYDKAKGTTSRKIHNKRVNFTEDLAIRLQSTQIECADALRIINSRDTAKSFFYVDPPYYNSDCGHYDGYSLQDYENLLTTLSKIQGKFLLSSYPSPVLKQFTKTYSWSQKQITLKVSVANNTSKPAKDKIEVFTANYDLSKTSWG
jgi:DNA adenine methylase